MKRALMSELASQIRGVSYKPTDLHDELNKDSVILLRANNINEGLINFDDVIYVDKKKVSSEQYLQKGDILICASSGSKNLVGKAAQVQFDGEYTFGAFCKVVRPTKISPIYLGMYFQSPGYRTLISSLAQGANINNIKSEHIDTLWVNTYEEETQIRITQILEKIIGIIQARKEELLQLDNLVKARFIELFGNFIYDRDKWQICEVGDVADTIDPQPSHRTPPVFSDGVPYIGIAECNYRTRLIDFEKARKVGQNVLQEQMERYTLDEGDFIIGKIGTIGKPFFVPTEQTYTLSANTVLIKPVKKKVNPQYLFAIFQSEYMDRIIDAEKKSTSQPAFGIQKVRRIEIPMPPMELQEQFAAFVEQTDKSKLAVQQSLEKLETLKKSLMQQYFG